MNTLVPWEILCLALLWSVFLRLIHVDKTTKPEVRIVLVVTGFAALMGAGAPLYGWLPDGITLVVLGSLVSMELILSRDWSHGIPVQYLKAFYRPHRRVGDPKP